MKARTYLGFDVGVRRTGVAIANDLIGAAHGIEVITHHQDGSTNWGQIDQIVSNHNVDLFVVGLAFDLQGGEQEITFIAKAFGKKLQQRYDIEAVFIDEHLSSNEAKNQLKYNHYHQNAKRGEVDKRSAQLILQTWLNETFVQH